MTTQQDSVDVERLRAAIIATIQHPGEHAGDRGWRSMAEWTADALLAALSLPITQRDEQGDQDGGEG